MAKKRKTSGPKRKSRTLNLRRYLIVSEDSKSSVDYLNAFPINRKLVDVQTVGGAGNTVYVVNKGIELREAAIARGQPYQHIFCVFDRDSFPQEDYEEAFLNARQFNNLTAIWSNECFEIWYLLHFAYRDTGIGRDALYSELGKTSRLGKAYKKGDSSIYDSLLERLPAAIRNSNKLLFEAKKERPNGHWNINPTTNVHKLIDVMLKLNAASEGELP